MRTTQQSNQMMVPNCLQAPDSIFRPGTKIDFFQEGRPDPRVRGERHLYSKEPSNRVLLQRSSPNERFECCRVCTDSQGPEGALWHPCRKSIFFRKGAPTHGSGAKDTSTQRSPRIECYCNVARRMSVLSAVGFVLIPRAQRGRCGTRAGNRFFWAAPGFRERSGRPPFRELRLSESPNGSADE